MIIVELCRYLSFTPFLFLQPNWKTSLRQQFTRWEGKESLQLLRESQHCRETVPPQKECFGEGEGKACPVLREALTQAPSEAGTPVVLTLATASQMIALLKVIAL